MTALSMTWYWASKRGDLRVLAQVLQVAGRLHEQAVHLFGDHRDEGPAGERQHGDHGERHQEHGHAAADTAVVEPLHDRVEAERDRQREHDQHDDGLERDHGLHEAEGGKRADGQEEADLERVAVQQGHAAFGAVGEAVGEVRRRRLGGPAPLAQPAARGRGRRAASPRTGESAAWSAEHPGRCHRILPCGSAWSLRRFPVPVVDGAGRRPAPRVHRAGPRSPCGAGSGARSPPRARPSASAIPRGWLPAGPVPCRRPPAGSWLPPRARQRRSRQPRHGRPRVRCSQVSASASRRAACSAIRWRAWSIRSSSSAAVASWAALTSARAASFSVTTLSRCSVASRSAATILASAASCDSRWISSAFAAASASSSAACCRANSSDGGTLVPRRLQLDGGLLAQPAADGVELVRGVRLRGVQREPGLDAGLLGLGLRHGHAGGGPGALPCSPVPRPAPRPRAGGSGCERRVVRSRSRRSASRRPEAAGAARAPRPWRGPVATRPHARTRPPRRGRTRAVTGGSHGRQRPSRRRGPDRRSRQVPRRCPLSLWP